MAIVSALNPIRQQALAVIAAKLGGLPSDLRRLEELGVEVVVELLIALEREFLIDLDPIDGLTVEALVRMVEAKAGKPTEPHPTEPGAEIFHWDDERARRALPLAKPIPVTEPEVLRARAVLEAIIDDGARAAEAAFSRETLTGLRFDLQRGTCRLCLTPAFINADQRCIACFAGPGDTSVSEADLAIPPAPRAEAAVPPDEAWEAAQAQWRRERAALIVASLSLVAVLAMGVGAFIALATSS